MIVEFTLDNKLCELQKLQQQLDALAEKWQLCKKTANHLNLVLEELFSNIVLHGACSAKHRVHFTLRKDDQTLHITVIDDGPKFDMTCSKTADTSLPLEQRKCGGLGILLVQKFCDGCSYSREDDKNIITLTKHLSTECG